MNILHLVRKKGETYPLEIAAAQKAAGDSVKVVMLQDAVMSCSGDGYCCKEDAEARGGSCGNLVDYRGIVKMIFEADSVVNW